MRIQETRQNGAEGLAKLVILRGNSGSGKTSLAQKLQEKFGPNTMRLSHDMVRMEILHVWSKEGVVKSFPLMIELLKYGRQNSAVTILEGILDSEQYQALFETAVEEFGQEIYAYYYDIPFEETLLRHSTKPNRHEFGEDDMRRWWREKDFIGFIPEKIFDKNLGLEEAAQLIYKEVNKMS